MMLIAHSARGGKLSQTYRDHITGVVAAACRNVEKFSPFVDNGKREFYKAVVGHAATYHDLGKLDRENQEVLSGQKKAKRLPVEHRDAGVSHLAAAHHECPSATLIYAHHRPGLPNLIEEKTKPHPFRFITAMENTEKHLGTYLTLHNEAVGDLFNNERTVSGYKMSALEYRMLLSSLVDADYSDSAGEQPSIPERRWSERLNRLSQYVRSLEEFAEEPNSERNQLRKQLYLHCHHAAVDETLEYCDSPVGTGKTTAIMAHMLKSAAINDLRHIFVVLPYTSLISQTVKTLREALVLDGEAPETIIAEHHHQADFETYELRHLAATWTAPIIVTTAVQFFETLASNIPSKIRKLHQLPGSGIILDESHALLPSSLMLPAWRWIAELASRWGCRVCFCSATSFKYWELPMFRKISPVKVIPLLTRDITEKLNNFENNRITLNVWQQQVPHFKNAEELIDAMEQYHGSKLVVLNTIRSAAYLASALRNRGHDVLHLSTALTPNDRETVIEEIKRRLSSPISDDRNWTLVATSCIECGMDFSFQYGFCELRSLSSYIQLSGRVSRNGEYENSSLHAFSITEDRFGYNPSFDISKNVFRKQIASGTLPTTSVTEAVTQTFDLECKMMGTSPDEINKLERKCAFLDVATNFKVIPEEHVTVVADAELAGKLSQGIVVSATEMQKGSVSMRRSVLRKLGCDQGELPVLEKEQYDSFLGYMKSLI
ncbi:DEAD/DEAH box helicase [Paenibacillus doosanensis]|uniref:CRISPR-associated helicase/endonuclease Cas3 n=1 Tax=Paenibacillus doosanensis TaxID=1229154 RepID=UPI00217FC522|nr:CRISPR-associated helicase/endonuclease Cas3 [Paenibacillus doosanensis]MCS7464203.1 DEAD/DEAH box helicase [Paenibacillus doosanensis]